MNIKKGEAVMDQNLIEFFKGPEFQSLPKIKQQYLKEMIELMADRPINEKIQIMMSYGFKMQNNGLALSQEEASMLMKVLQANLTPEERARFEQFSKMI
jgi:Spy/CpxP family protein refolding chaperone